MRPASAVLAAVAAVAAVTASAGVALAAPAGHAVPAPSNPGAASPSLSLSASASGVPEAAVIGKNDSLWYYTKVKGKWKRTEVAGPNSAFSGSSLVSGPGTDVAIAVEGPKHSLDVYVKVGGRWHRLIAAGANTTYAAPSVAVSGLVDGIAVEGKNHSLWFRWLGGSSKWQSKEILGSGRAYSAPSLVIRSALQASSTGGAGQADIAYDGPDGSLAYVHSAASYRRWVNDPLGVKLAYSAPSLVVLDGADASQGEAVMAVEGPHHSLWTYANGSGSVFAGTELLSRDSAFSAPSVVQNDRDPRHSIEIAYRGASASLGVLLFLGTGWQNDPLGRLGTVESAPALAAQGSNGQLDLIYQGTADTLWYDTAPVPPTPVAPTFTGSRIGSAGSTYGG